MVNVSASVIFPCTIKSRRRFLLTLAYSGSPRKRAVKRSCMCACVSIYKNGKHLSVPCYFLAPCDKHKHTAHAHQQAASQASTDSAWRHPVLLLQRPVGCRSYSLTPQAAIAQSAIVACSIQLSTLYIICNREG